MYTYALCPRKTPAFCHRNKSLRASAHLHPPQPAYCFFSLPVNCSSSNSHCIQRCYTFVTHAVIQAACRTVIIQHASPLTAVCSYFPFPFPFRCMSNIPPPFRHPPRTHMRIARTSTHRSTSVLHARCTRTTAHRTHTHAHAARARPRRSSSGHNLQGDAEVTGIAAALSHRSTYQYGCRQFSNANE